jgi:hypothetical protein
MYLCVYLNLVSLMIDVQLYVHANDTSVYVN